MRIGAFHNAQVVSSIPSMVIGCEPRSGYASVHICWPAHWHFCLLANASRATMPVSIVYYFLLCLRAVASSLVRQHDRILKNILHSVFNRDILLNCSKFIECFSFGIHILSKHFHCPVTLPFHHLSFTSLHN